MRWLQSQVAAHLTVNLKYITATGRQLNLAMNKSVVPCRPHTDNLLAGHTSIGNEQYRVIVPTNLCSMLVGAGRAIVTKEKTHAIAKSKGHKLPRHH